MNQLSFKYSENIFCREKLSGDQDGWIKKRKRLESAEDEPLSKKQKDDDHV